MCQLAAVYMPIALNRRFFYEASLDNIHFNLHAVGVPCLHGGQTWPESVNFIAIMSACLAGETVLCVVLQNQWHTERPKTEHTIIAQT